jgi:hypothetical protein
LSQIGAIVQAANSLVRATAEAVRVAGWAVAAALLVFMPLSTFFLINAASFVVSALLIAGVRTRRVDRDASAHVQIREGFVALRALPALTVAVIALGAGVTIGSGAWMVGVPQLVHKIGLGAGSFSAVAAGYAVGAVSAGLLLSRVRIRHKARATFYLWVPYAAAYGLFALAETLPPAVLAGAVSGAIQSALMILIVSAAQEEIPDALLGRVAGLISLVHRGAHASGLIFMGPLFVVFATRTVFWAAAVSLPLVGLAGLAAANAARARARR